jgi:hypothetical protein
MSKPNHIDELKLVYKAIETNDIDAMDTIVGRNHFSKTVVTNIIKKVIQCDALTIFKTFARLDNAASLHNYMCFAIYTEAITIIKSLMIAGADICRDNDYPINIACFAGSIQVIELFESFEPTIMSKKLSECLYCAVMCNAPEKRDVLVEHFLTKGADPKADIRALRYAISHNMFKTLTIFIRFGTGVDYIRDIAQEVDAESFALNVLK